jgi:hypothetical protein
VTKNAPTALTNAQSDLKISITNIAPYLTTLNYKRFGGDRTWMA